MLKAKIRITKRDEKGRFQSHTIKTISDLENLVLLHNGRYFYYPLLGRLRRYFLRKYLQKIERVMA